MSLVQVQQGEPLFETQLLLGFFVSDKKPFFRSVVIVEAKSDNTGFVSYNMMNAMTEYFLLLVGTVFVNNFVLVKFLGLCPFMGVSKKVDTAFGMGLATTFVLTLASVSSYLVETYILAPFGIEYLRTLSFILVIAVVVQFTELLVQKTSPVLYRLLGIFLP